MTDTLLTLLSRAHTGSALTPSGRLGVLPWFVRLSLADLFTYARYGEQTAVVCAQTIVELETDPTARAFALTQLRDEQSHFAFFDALVRELNMGRALKEPLKGLFGLAATQTTLPAVLVANHLIVESLAHDLFAEISKRLLDFDRWWVPRSWRAALCDVAEGMNGITRDESRHVAFGVLRTRKLREEMNEAGRAELDAMACVWFGQLKKALATVERRPFFKATRRAISRTVLDRCQRRCRDAGVEVA